MSTEQGRASFDHLVVLMLENRSFDNLFGFLYEDDEPSHFIPDVDPVFRGVAGRNDLVNERRRRPSPTRSSSCRPRSWVRPSRLWKPQEMP